MEKLSSSNAHAKASSSGSTGLVWIYSLDFLGMKERHFLLITKIRPSTLFSVACASSKMMGCMTSITNRRRKRDVEGGTSNGSSFLMGEKRNEVPPLCASVHIV